MVSPPVVQKMPAFFEGILLRSAGYAWPDLFSGIGPRRFPKKAPANQLLP
jgi:hypothetical protein